MLLNTAEGFSAVVQDVFQMTSSMSLSLVWGIVGSVHRGDCKTQLNWLSNSAGSSPFDSNYDVVTSVGHCG